MKLEIAIETDDEITPALARVRRGLSGAGRPRLHSMIGRRVVETVRNHLIKIAPQRHRTANSLGAQPTRHLERGLEGIRPALLQDEVQIFIPIPGISRAFHDLTITPRAGSKYLTIPATAEAYGRRARSFRDLRVQVFRKKGGGQTLALVKAEQTDVRTRQRSGFLWDRVIARTVSRAGRRVNAPVYYWLVEKVEQKQDRELMPSDGELLDACEAGAEDFIGHEFFKTQVKAA